MLFILPAHRLRNHILTASHAGTGLLIVNKVCFCFAVCAPRLPPLSLSAKSVSRRFDKRICAGVEGVNEFHLPCLTGRDSTVWSGPD